jgi:hypothetical protein
MHGFSVVSDSLSRWFSDLCLSLSIVKTLVDTQFVLFLVKLFTKCVNVMCFYNTCCCTSSASHVEFSKCVLTLESTVVSMLTTCSDIK